MANLITQSTKGLEFKLAEGATSPSISQGLSEVWKDISCAKAGGRYYNYSFSTEKRARFYHGVRMSAIWSYVGHP